VGITVYCVKLTSEDMPHYLNKIEEVGLTQCLYYDYLTKKVMSQ